MKRAKCRGHLGLLRVAIFAVLVVVPPRPFFAAPVTGTLDIGGSEAQVGSTFMNFLTNPALTPVSPPGYGNFIASGGNASFVPYITEKGFIHSLNFIAQPINQTFSLPNFLFFNPSATLPAPDIALDLNFIFVGIFSQAQCAAAPAPGQTCTPAFPALVSAANPLGLSPYDFTNTLTGSTLSISVSGTARRISTGETSSFTGILTEQFNVPFQTVFANIVTGTMQNSYSATFNVVPEPAAWSLFAFGGLSFIGLSCWRIVRKS